MIRTKKPQAGKLDGFLYATRHKFLHTFNNYNSSRFREQSKLLRVNKRKPCVICGKSKWCSYSEDGNIALCMNNSAGSAKAAKNGAYVHILNPQDESKVSAYSAIAISRSGNSGKSKPAVFHADADRKNEIYTFLLDALELTERHGDGLLNERGLCDTTIAYKLYASVPPTSVLAELMTRIREMFGERLKGVAGFYKNENGIWQFNKPPEGFFVPYRDERGRIQALQVRLDYYIENNKYIWLSTNPDNEKFKDGASSGAPLHYVLPNTL